jgi:AraC-like DNA-binding protein
VPAIRNGSCNEPSCACCGRTAGRAGIAELAERLGLTERGLHRRAVGAFGYRPKLLHRVLRFRRAVRLARSGLAFATVAADAGYADQAHLAREVRELAGVPLGVLLAEQRYPSDIGRDIVVA